ncbi:sensor histidine kinase [Streptomyces sp. M92]|uniref:sensor histidine kinase n=1 Tax=Streptomyces sp. M92 TaxID=2944250 RepID=UPI00234AC237|nr:sensor histidine kinase [Streptomyces sp. M92]WCN04467.1 histidine kinase [Streptomyces sp. M92]
MRRWQDIRRLTVQLLRNVAADRPFTRPVDHVLLLVLLSPSALDTELPAVAPAVWLAACLVVAVAVAVRRAAPLTSLLLAALLALFLPWSGASAWPAVAAAVLSWGAGRRLPRVWPAQLVFVCTTAAGIVLVGAVAEVKDGLSLLMLQFASCVLPWWAGNWRRQRAALAHAGWEHAERLEWRQRYVAEQARRRERARIAQDIHDSLGHELSVMALLAGGLELSGELSDEHRATAGRLRERCTLATERLHEAVGLLREDTGPSLVPAQESIAQLVRRFGGAATPVDFREEGAAPVPGAQGLAGLAAYRVVQEALTNAAKHAPGAPVSVRVDHRPDETVVSVVNERPRNGGSPSATGSGAGLIGLDERVRLAGGTLRAGPSRGGFGVHARLPHTPGAAPPRAPIPPGYDTAAPPWPVGGAGTDEAAGTAPDARAGARPGRSTSRTALLRARARLRGDARRAALLPVLLGAAIAALLTGLYAATSATTSVTPADYGRIRVGETRAELETVLPSRRIGKPPPALSEPAAPPGAACEYYRASQSLLDFTGTMYRLCFTDDVLTAKDRL